MHILDLSKVLMYKFHYSYIKNKYVNNSRLLFTDTDSLIDEIKPEDVYKVFSKNIEMFDCSNYLAKTKYYDDSKKLVVAKMKYERDGVAIEEFVGLKSKTDLFLVDDSSEHKKATGTKKVIMNTKMFC